MRSKPQEMRQWQQKWLSSSLQERSPQEERHSSQFPSLMTGAGWFAIGDLSDFSSLLPLLPSPEQVLYWVSILGLGYGVYYLSSILSTLPDEEDEDSQEEGCPKDSLSEKDNREDD